MGEGIEVFETPMKGSNIESKELPSQQERDNSWHATGPQPLREEQVQNAMKFLSHPKVKGSPMIHRCSFLERKGMTKEEIDEAFRRVPEPPEAGNAVVSLEGAEKQVTTLVTSKALAPLQASPQHFGQVALPANIVQPIRFRWTRMVLVIGVFTLAGAGAAVFTKNYILPKFKAWLRRILLEDHESKLKRAEPSPLEEVVSAAAAATAAAAAASEIAAVTRYILSRRSEDHEYFKKMMKAVEMQTQELKLTLSTMREAVLSIEKATHRSATHSLPVNGSQIGNASVSYKSLGPIQQASNEQKSWEKPGKNSTVPFASATSKVPDSAYMRRANDKENRNLSNNFLNDNEKSSVFLESAATSSSSELWWRRKKSDSDYAHSSSNSPTKSNIRITELEPDNDTNTQRAGKAYSSLAQPRTSAAAVTSIVTEDRQGWVPPPVPQTVLPGAAAAIRYQKVLINGCELQPPPAAHFSASSGGQSSSGNAEVEPALSVSLADGTQSDTQCVAYPESPNGQELNVIGESILEKLSYKDVLVEGGL